MKKYLSLSLGLIFLAMAVLPSAGYSWRGYPGPYRYHGGGYHNGWAVGAGIAGGLLLGVILGNALSRPAYYEPPPSRVYAYPEPVYVYPPPSPAYAYPAPASAALYERKGPPGEWVTVPGQWVEGMWVSQHRVWVPANP